MTEKQKPDVTVEEIEAQMPRAQRFVEIWAQLKKHNSSPDFHLVKETVNKEKYGGH